MQGKSLSGPSFAGGEGGVECELTAEHHLREDVVAERQLVRAMTGIDLRRRLHRQTQRKVHMADR